MSEIKTHDVLQGLSELIKVIFHKAQPKRMNNSIITGPMLAALTEAYVDAINKGAVPTIATAWQVLLHDLADLCKPHVTNFVLCVVMLTQAQSE